MRIKFLLLAVLISGGSMKAQETQRLTLEEAVNLALAKSDASKIADAKVNSTESQLNVTKNLQYPDVDISGQYRYLTGADVKLKTQTSDSAGKGTAQPDVKSLLFGQANVSMPIFSGFKLKNTIKAGENQFKAAQFNAKNEKEQLALQTIQDYLNLYKA
ncbi:MAG: TolC family protein, partial [Aequorivita sp.]|nr:TolC family protein [Aequorivita sp.]